MLSNAIHNKHKVFIFSIHFLNLLINITNGSGNRIIFISAVGSVLSGHLQFKLYSQ